LRDRWPGTLRPNAVTDKGRWDGEPTQSLAGHSSAVRTISAVAARPVDLDRQPREHVGDARHGIVDEPARQVRLGGLAVVLAGFYFYDEARSRWRVVLYVDEQASPAQQRWLADIWFLGRAGGTTLRNFAAAIGEMHAVCPARIELRHTPGRWRIRANDWVTVAATQFVDANETVACGVPGFDHPGQEVRAKLLHVDDAPLRWAIRERCGFATNFNYRSDG
jgi:hypothetical protein